MSTFYQLEFEHGVREIEKAMEAISASQSSQAVPGPGVPPGVTVEEPVADQPPKAGTLDELARERDRLLGEIYTKLTPWNTVRVARHPKRPQGRDYIELICRDFAELHGDRRFGDDPAIVTGFGRIGPFKCLVVAHHKGRDTQEKIACHFGCAHPEGYRKALAKMKMAEKFGLPVVTFVDTPGAYPGLGAEQRGQAEAIAVNLLEMSRLRTPIVSVVIGEGGSGGALGIAVADKVAMLQHAWYSVISPEGCAAILWKQANEKTNSAAAEALRLTAADNLELGIVDDVIKEPLGGAHRDRVRSAQNLMNWVVEQLETLTTKPIDQLLEARYQRFRRLGSYTEHPEEIATPPDENKLNEDPDTPDPGRSD